jgi:hypothetical protein
MDSNAMGRKLRHASTNFLKRMSYVEVPAVLLAIFSLLPRTLSASPRKRHTSMLSAPQAGCRASPWPAYAGSWQSLRSSALS